MPFDQFTIEQIAGDLLPNATLDQTARYGLPSQHPDQPRRRVDNAQFRIREQVDRTSTVGSRLARIDAWAVRNATTTSTIPSRRRIFTSIFAFFDNAEEVDIEAPRPGELGPYLQRRHEYDQKSAGPARRISRCRSFRRSGNSSCVQAIAEPGQIHGLGPGLGCCQEADRGR